MGTPPWRAFHHGGKLAKAAFPSAHDFSKPRIGRDEPLGLGAFVRTKGAEDVFRRKHVLVFVDRHDPMHSRRSIKLRLSQVLIIFTGLSNLAASCSRLNPL